MTDHVDSRTRSEIMARVKSRDTRPEMQVRRTLHRAGHRFRIHRSDLPGCPDLLFPKYGIALFVHGCFWHWHGCKRSRMPKTNVEYWITKIERNVHRDVRTRCELESLGWKWRVVWECETESGVKRLLEELNRDAALKKPFRAISDVPGAVANPFPRSNT